VLAGDNLGANKLFQIAAGIRTDVATGRQYEMQKRQGSFEFGLHAPAMKGAMCLYW
jgi:hypothetical protein